MSDMPGASTHDNVPHLPPLKSVQNDSSPTIQHGATSLSNVDTRDNEFIQKLTAQLADKDAMIR